VEMQTFDDDENVPRAASNGESTPSSSSESKGKSIESDVVDQAKEEPPHDKDEVGWR